MFRKRELLGALSPEPEGCCAFDDLFSCNHVFFGCPFRPCTKMMSALVSFPVEDGSNITVMPVSWIEGAGSSISTSVDLAGGWGNDMVASMGLRYKHTRDAWRFRRRHTASRSRGMSVSADFIGRRGVQRRGCRVATGQLPCHVRAMHLRRGGKKSCESGTLLSITSCSSRVAAARLCSSA